MQDSRMIAEVAPPGVCAMPKVSGSRIATPSAPPRPGSTPMTTPRITPTNINAMLVGQRATLKPCSSHWISSISAQTQQVFQRPLRQRHLEPFLEHQVENHRGAEAHGGHFPPPGLAQPAHEETDEKHRGRADADPRD